jgi:hypothetical protein
MQAEQNKAAIIADAVKCLTEQAGKLLLLIEPR